jgi:hypothetical protein
MTERGFPRWVILRECDVGTFAMVAVLCRYGLIHRECPLRNTSFVMLLLGFSNPGVMMVGYQLFSFYVVSRCIREQLTSLVNLSDFRSTQEATFAQEHAFVGPVCRVFCGCHGLE